MINLKHTFGSTFAFFANAKAKQKNAKELPSQHTSQSLQKSVPAQPHRQSITADSQTTTERRAACNSTYPKGGVSCSKDSFVVNQTLVFQIKFCGKSPALRVAANRYTQGKLKA